MEGNFPRPLPSSFFSKDLLRSCSPEGEWYSGVGCQRPQLVHMRLQVDAVGTDGARVASFILFYVHTDTSLKVSGKKRSMMLTFGQKRKQEQNKITKHYSVIRAIHFFTVQNPHNYTICAAKYHQQKISNLW